MFWHVLTLTYMMIYSETLPVKQHQCMQSFPVLILATTVVSSLSLAALKAQRMASVSSALLCSAALGSFFAVLFFRSTREEVKRADRKWGRWTRRHHKTNKEKANNFHLRLRKYFNQSTSTPGSDLKVFATRSAIGAWQVSTRFLEVGQLALT